MAGGVIGALSWHRSRMALTGCGWQDQGSGAIRHGTSSNAPLADSGECSGCNRAQRQCRSGRRGVHRPWRSSRLRGGGSGSGSCLRPASGGPGWSGGESHARRWLWGAGCGCSPCGCSRCGTECRWAGEPAGLSLMQQLISLQADPVAEVHPEVGAAIAVEVGLE